MNFSSLEANPLPQLGLRYLPVTLLRWHVGDVIKKLREQRHWNQLKLAGVAKLSKATIVRVEENESGIKRETYEQIAHALETTMGALFSLIPPDVHLPDATREARAARIDVDTEVRRIEREAKGAGRKR